jgi:hypothetical protein
MSVANVFGQFPAGSSISTGGTGDVMADGDNTFTGYNIFNGVVECNSSLFSNDLCIAPLDTDDWFLPIGSNQVISSNIPRGTLIRLLSSSTLIQLTLPSTPPAGFKFSFTGTIGTGTIQFINASTGGLLTLQFVSSFGNGLGETLETEPASIGTVYWSGSGYICVLNNGNWS